MIEYLTEERSLTEPLKLNLKSLLKLGQKYVKKEITEDRWTSNLIS